MRHKKQKKTIQMKFLSLNEVDEDKHKIKNVADFSQSQYLAKTENPESLVEILVLSLGC